jgi:hypothetical protein
VLSVLGRQGLRCLRAACRAGRAAANARVTSAALELRGAQAPLAPLPPSLPNLQRVDFGSVYSLAGEAEARDLSGALASAVAALPDSVVGIEMRAAASSQLSAAIGARRGLQSLGFASDGEACVDVLGALVSGPSLTSLTSLKLKPHRPWAPPPALLQRVPWQQLQVGHEPRRARARRHRAGRRSVRYRARARTRPDAFCRRNGLAAGPAQRTVHAYTQPCNMLSSRAHLSNRAHRPLPPPPRSIHPGQELAVKHAAPVAPALCSSASLPRLRALQLSFDGLLHDENGDDVDDDGEDAHALALVWAAPWLSQLTRLDLGVNRGLVAAAVPRGGLDLPQLRELWLRGPWKQGGGLTPSQATAVAACRLPCLEALGLENPAPGSIPALMAAPWAAGLSRLELMFWPGCCDAQAVAALAHASSLASLTLHLLSARIFINKKPGLDGPRLAALLAAPWSTSLQRLELTRQQLGKNRKGDAARAALAAAALPALRSLCLKDTRVTLGGLAELAAAPWARGLVELKAKGCGMYPAKPSAADRRWQLALAAFAGVALPSLRSLSFEYFGPLTADALLWFSRRAPWLSQLESLTITGFAATPGDLEVWEAATEAGGPPSVRPGADCTVTLWNPRACG